MLTMTALFIIVIIGSSFLPLTLQLPAILLSLIGIAAVTLVSINRGASIEGALVVPTVMSAFQNVYLLPFAAEYDELRMQVIVIVNFLVALLLLALLLLSGAAARLTATGSRLFRQAQISSLVVLLWGGLLMATNGIDPLAGFASLRNLWAPFLFLSLGLLAATWTPANRYAQLLAGLGAAVIAFGFWEVANPHFWTDWNLEQLWEKKGIPVDPYTHLPPNFYSSEQIEGNQIRRMVGPFADPVNLGTFIFAVTMCAWYVRRRVLLAVSLLAVILTVSKGAFLGCLIAVAVGIREYRSKFETLVAITVVAIVAFLFYGYTQSSSTGSTTAHINGLTAAFAELPSNPLGRGLGGTGVLSGLLGEGGDSAIVESGVGMIVGQLGVVGLATYAWFFYRIISWSLTVENPQDRVMASVLALAFFANAMFNEVALSPNSCAPYFVLLGLILGRAEIRKIVPARDHRRESRRATIDG